MFQKEENLEPRQPHKDCASASQRVSAIVPQPQLSINNTVYPSTLFMRSLYNISRQDWKKKNSWLDENVLLLYISVFISWHNKSESGNTGGLFIFMNS